MKTKETKNKNEEHVDKEKDFWTETKENVNEGAKVVGDTISDYSEKIAHTFKDATSKVLKFSSEFTMDMVHKAEEIIDNYRDKYEINRLSTKRDQITAQLGLHLYRSVKDNKNDIPKDFMEHKLVVSLLKEIEEIDAKIIEFKENESKK